MPEPPRTEELRRQDETTCAVYGVPRALTPSLVVSKRKAWRGVIGLRRLPRIGVGVPGGAGAGGGTGRDVAFNLPARVGHLFGANL